MDLNIGRRSGLISCTALVLLLCACTIAPVTTVTLRADAPQALAEAAQAHQAVLLVYAAPWCGACRALKEVLHTDMAARALASVQVVHVEVDTQLQTAAVLPAHLMPSTLKLQAVPTLLYLHPDHPTDTTTQLQGYVGARRLALWLDGARLR